jgi:trimethylamine:corrinoid methyltransferase-like protein
LRHLDALFDMLTLSDKPIHAYSLGRDRNLDALEMIRIARGLDWETLEREPSLFTPSSTRRRRCGWTGRCWKASSRWRGAISRWC